MNNGYARIAITVLYFTVTISLNEMLMVTGLLFYSITSMVASTSQDIISSKLHQDIVDDSDICKVLSTQEPNILKQKSADESGNDLPEERIFVQAEFCLDLTMQDVKCAADAFCNIYKYHRAMNQYFAIPIVLTLLTVIFYI